MALKIGRAGLTLTLPEPQAWSSSGGQVTVQGSIQNAATPTDALRLRDQLLGYVDNWDEPVVPVIVDGEPKLTGYYRVLGVQILTDPTAIAFGYLVFSITLQPVKGFAQPMMESILTDALLTNAVGGVAADHQAFHGVPASVTEYSQSFSSLNPPGTRSSADGNLFFEGLNVAAGSATLMTGTASFYLTPANFYVGAATIEQGSPLQPVVGRAMLADVVNWRLSNGLVRVTPNATAGKIDIAHWKSASWATAKTYKFTGTVLRGLINGWTAITVLRNSVEECILRLSCTSATGFVFPIFLDISLRRGDRLARIYLTNARNYSDKWSVFRDSVEAATAITYGAVTLGGFRATANDSDSNRYVLLSYQAAVTSDLVNGGLTQNVAAAAMDIGIGSEIAGSAAVDPDKAAELAGQYLAAQSEAQRVVAR